MKLSNEKIVNSIPALNNLSNKDLPIRASFFVAKNIRELTKTVETFNSEKSKIMKKYCKKKEDGSLDVKIDGTVDICDQENWDKEYKELLNIESDVDITKIHVSELGNVTLTPSSLITIDFMLEE